MKKLILLIAVMSGIASPAQALSSRASVNLRAIVPVSCSIDFIGGAIVGSQVVLHVQRTCNTNHRLIFASGAPESSGRITMSFNGEASRPVNAGEISLDQPERYYNGVDRIVIDAGDNNEADLLTYVSSLSIGIDPQ